LRFSGQVFAGARLSKFCGAVFSRWRRPRRVPQVTLRVLPAAAGVTYAATAARRCTSYGAVDFVHLIDHGRLQSHLGWLARHTFLEAHGFRNRCTTAMPQTHPHNDGIHWWAGLGSTLPEPPNAGQFSVPESEPDFVSRIHCFYYADNRRTRNARPDSRPDSGLEICPANWSIVNQVS